MKGEGRVLHVALGKEVEFLKLEESIKLQGKLNRKPIWIITNFK